MIKEFNKFIIDNKLFDKEDNILLAISGGIDSMVMLDLFKKSNFKFSIAHCNFQLRENDSNLDEYFVKNYAEKNGIDFYIKKFKTIDYKNQNNISTQMAARELRYNWFNEIAKNHNYKYIATAHHLDDQIETFFINLIRGTGIAGIHGILAKTNNNIIRPLLFASRLNIEEYLRNNNLDYREDKSNDSDKYLRNYIRHNIVPEFKNLNKNFAFTLDENLKKLRDVEEVYKNATKFKMAELIDLQDEKIIICIDELKKLNPLKPYLFEFLSLYNFNETCIENLMKSLYSSESGKQFYSSTNRIIKDRKQLILLPFQNTEEIIEEKYFIKSDFKSISNPLKLNFELNNDLGIIKNDNIAQLDFDKLEFPLEIRRWRKGDYFYPLGMSSKKKLSDYFIDNKLSVYDKEGAWLLISNNSIVWIIGHRMDNRFKMDENTKKVFKIELQK